MHGVTGSTVALSIPVPTPVPTPIMGLSEEPRMTTRRRNMMMKIVDPANHVATSPER